MKQTVSAARAVQMYEALKRGPHTADELADLTHLKEATVERWISILQTYGCVRVGGVDGPTPWYRWVTTTKLHAHEVTV